MEFWDRVKELGEIARHAGRGRFGFVTGRRRVGKTALLLQAIQRLGGIYHQAVEGTTQQQLLHVAEELKDTLPIFRDVTPKRWEEFFRLLSREKLPKLLVFDEFPYWVEGDPSLPSLLQKWIDHQLPKRRTLVLVSGSSQSMLYSQFLDRSAPLYGRVSFHLHLQPMSYHWFCRALGYDLSDPTSFVRFCLVGGVPHYWKLLPKRSLLEQARILYFEPAAILAEEPTHWIRDERITGMLPKAILDLIGRGVTKPSELASRLGMPQSNLSRPLGMLLELGLIQRELPFGESSRTTKRVHYFLQDQALSFYFSAFLPLRSRWAHLSQKEKSNVLHRHASIQWENFCRQAFPGSSRYWEGGIELDLVAYRKGRRPHLVAECKWKLLKPSEEKGYLHALRTKFLKTKLSRKLRKVDYRLFTIKNLPQLAESSS